MADFPQVHVRDREAGTTRRIATNAEHPRISADGRHVVFESFEAASRQVYRHDLATGETVRVSAAPTGDIPAGDASRPAISADGARIVFQSNARDMLADKDLGTQLNVFVAQTAD